MSNIKKSYMKTGRFVNKCLTIKALIFLPRNQRAPGRIFCRALMQLSKSSIPQDGCNVSSLLQFFILPNHLDIRVAAQCILYGQFMNTRDGPKVVEFNSRFGDPEAMNVLSLLESDFAAILCRIIEGTLSQAHVRFAPKATVCKYLVPEGYPDAPVSGAPITVGDYGDALLYYANVGEKDGRMVTLQSRTMAFVGLGDSLTEAEEIAERAASSVTGGVWYRHDIGKPALLDKRIKHMKEIR